MKIDQIAEKVETLIEKIKSLKYGFSDEELRSEAEQEKDLAIEHLERWLEMATDDVKYEGESEE